METVFERHQDSLQGVYDAAYDLGYWIGAHAGYLSLLAGLIGLAVLLVLYTRHARQLRSSMS